MLARALALRAQAAHGGRKDKTRLNTGHNSGAKVTAKAAAGGKIGGDFTVQKNAPFLAARNGIFETIKVKR